MSSIARLLGRGRRDSQSIRRHRGSLSLRPKVRDDLLAEEPDRVQHLLVPRRPDGTQQEDFLDAQRLVHLDKPDAVRRRADAEFAALLAHLLRRRLAGMRSAGETLVARVIALVIRWHGLGIIVAPHQAGAL